MGVGDGIVQLSDQTISFSSLNPNATTSATITFSVRGDFNESIENVTLSVDGFNFETWLNDNLGDDDINGPNATDNGNQYSSILTGTAIVPLADLTSRIADGQLDFFFDYSEQVIDFFPLPSVLDLAQVQVEYEAVMAPVPTPSAMLLFGTGLAALVGWNYRKTKKV